MQGVKQSVCPCVVVVVSTKITRSRVLGIYVCCKHNQSVDIDEKLVSTCTNYMHATVATERAGYVLLKALVKVFSLLTRR